MGLVAMFQTFAHKRVVQHIVFWVIALVVMTFLYSIYIKSFWSALHFSVFFWLIQLAYFYTVAYWVIPKTLLRKRYVSFILSSLFCFFVAILLFRLVEIFYADPYVYQFLNKLNQSFTWEKMQGNFWQQLLHFPAFMNALEQTNMVVWFAVAIKLFKLYWERREAAVEAELNFLKSQIQPHFLFNTLNSLYALTLNRSPQAPNAVINLAQILRYILYECNAECVKLSKELEIIEQYIALEKLRSDRELDVNLNLTGQIEAQQIAPLLLLPLVENAFKHGVQEAIDPGWMNIQMIVTENYLSFKIANTKPVKAKGKSGDTKHSIGLANIQKRLHIMYPNAHQLRIYDEEEDVFAVVMEINLNQLAS
ncbi:histidine kinase [Olivibacter ginsenosidimutans]|uniref:Histidine kinase n=1 Tax=Olivibacter ginsenosidimutans TaxID=1176537 RepID=A0ABP9BQ43_9SPHI